MTDEAGPIRASLQIVLDTGEHAEQQVWVLRSQIEMIQNMIRRVDVGNVSLLMPRTEQALDNLHSIYGILQEIRVEAANARSTL